MRHRLVIMRTDGLRPRLKEAFSGFIGVIIVLNTLFVALVTVQLTTFSHQPSASPIVIHSIQRTSYSTQQSYESLVEDLNPVGYWPLQEATGITANDATGPNYGTPTAGGPPELDLTPGPITGSSYDYFPPGHSDGYLLSSESNSAMYPSTAITMAAWVDPVDTYLDPSILNLGDNSQILGLSNEDDDPQGTNELAGTFTDNAGTSSISSPAIISEDTWNFVVMTVSATGLVTLYVNGVPEAETQIASYTNLNYGTAASYIGTNYNSSDLYQGGMLDVSLYNYALSANQIASLCDGYCPVTLKVPFTIQSTYGGCSCTNAAEPVNTMDGDFWDRTTDLTVPGPGIPLALTRTYDAMAAESGATGPLGPGWSSNLTMNVSVTGSSPNEVATVTLANGAQYQFDQTSGDTNSWCPPSASYDFCPTSPRYTDTLNQNGNNTFTFTEGVQGTLTYTFSSANPAQLTDIQDASGDSLQATYETSGCPGSAPSCTVWTSYVGTTAGHTLTLDYNSADELEAAIGSAAGGATPQQAVFCYYGSGSSCSAPSNGSPSGDLFSATDPGLLATYYTYNSSNEVLNEVGPTTATYSTSLPALVNEYNSSGQVIQQTDPADQATTFCYTGNGDSASGGQTEVVTYPDGVSGTACDPTGTYQETLYQYSEGALEYTTAGDTPTSSSTQSVVPDPTSALPAITSDGNDNPTTQTFQTYDPGVSGTPLSSANVLTTTDALGNTTQTAYDTDNQVWCQVDAANYANDVRCPSSQLTSASIPPAGTALPDTNCPTLSNDTCLGATITYFNSSTNEAQAVTGPRGYTSYTAYTSGSTGVPANLVYCTVSGQNYASGTSCPSTPPGTPPTGTTTGYTTNIYNSVGEETSTTNPTGATTSYTYGADASPPAGCQSTVGSNITPTLPATVTSPSGTVTCYTYDSDGRVTEEVQVFGTDVETTLHAYNQQGLLYCTISPLSFAEGHTSCPSPPSSPPTPGSSTRNDASLQGYSLTIYDNDNRPIYQINPLGGVTQTAYNQAGEIYCTVSAWDYSYFNSGAGVACPSTPPSSPPTGDATGYTTNIYNTLGQETSTTDPIGDTTTKTYDSAGNVTSTTTIPTSTTNDPSVTTYSAYDADDHQVATCTNPTVNSVNGTGDAWAGHCGQAGMESVSCPTAGWCMAIDNAGNALLYSSGTWSPTNIDPASPLTAISCYSETFCVAVDSQGHAISWNGAWSTNPTDIDGSTALTGVSCPTASFCGTVDTNGQFLTDSSGTWSTSPIDIDGEAPLAGISCTSATSCTAVDRYGYAIPLSYNGTSWTTGTHVWIDQDQTLEGISCPAAGDCRAIDNQGNIFVETSSSWAGPDNVDPGHALGSISCPTTLFCATVDNAGNVVIDDASGITVTSVDGSSALTAIGCSASTSCVTADGTGYTSTYNGTNWSTPSFTDQPSSTADTTTLENHDPNGNTYCTASADAFALGPYNAPSGAGGYQCPPWQASWISSPPNLSPSATSPLYSYAPNSSQALGVSLSFEDSDGNAMETVTPDLTQAENAPYASPSISPTIEAFNGDEQTYCSSDATDSMTWFLTNTTTYPFMCPSTAPSSPPTGTAKGYTTTVYSDSDQTLSVTDPLGDTTLTTYNSNGNKTAVVNPDGDVTNYCYGFEDGAGGCASSLTSGSWSAAKSLGSSTVVKVSCATMTVCASLDATDHVTVENEGTWSSPTTLSATGTGESLSCASPGFCVAGDNTGNVYSYSGSTWSSGTSLDSGASIRSLSCATATLCAAGDSNGKAFTYNGSAWSAASTLDSSATISAVSCTQSPLCAAGDSEGKIFTFTGSSWSSATTLDSGYAIDSVSCFSSTLCVAGDSRGRAYVFNGTSWSTYHILETGDAVDSISCASAQFCVAGNSNGHVYVYNGSSWSTGSTLDSTHAIESVACPTITSCVVIDATGGAFTYNGTAWSSGTDFDGSTALVSVSCATGNLCEAGDAGDNVFAWHESNWLPPVNAESSNELKAVSCVTIVSCVAVDNAGIALNYNGASWTSDDADGSTAMASISCPTMSFCMAGDTAGKILINTGSSSWTSSTFDSGKTVAAVSCISATFCAAGDSAGKVGIYTGSWSALTTLHASTTIGSISCASSTFCIAGNSKGDVWSYGSSGWNTTATALGASTTTMSVSCPSVSWCMAVGTNGDAYTFNGSTWSSGTPVDAVGGLESVSCPTTLLCQAVDNEGNDFTWMPSGWSSAASIDGSTALASVSCTNSSLCLAVDGASANVLESLGSALAEDQVATQTPSTSVDPSGALTSTTYLPGDSIAVTTTLAGSTIAAYDSNGDKTASMNVSPTTGFGPAPSVTTSYNQDGSRSQMIDGNGSTAYNYDDAGDLLSQAFTANSSSHLANQTLSYTYDAAGTVGQITYPSYTGETNPEVTYTYNALGQMSSVTDWESNAVDFSYDQDGNETSQENDVSSENPNGTSWTNFSYDLGGNQTTVATTTVDATPGTISPETDEGGAYGPAGPTTPEGAVKTDGATGHELPASSQTDCPENDWTFLWSTSPWSYAPGSRNPDGQVTSVTFAYAPCVGSAFGLTNHYSYDEAGRLVYYAYNGPPQGNSPDNVTPDPAGNDTLAAQGPQSFDNAGELTSQPETGSSGTTFTYDPLGDLTAETQSGTTTPTYGYDQLGQMTSYSSSSTSTAYTYNGDGLEASNEPSGASAPTQLLWNEEGSLPELVSDGNDYFVYGPGQTPVEQYNITSSPPSSNPTFVNSSTDDGMSSYVITATDGDYTNYWQYDPFGNLWGGTAVGSSFGFAGQYTDLASSNPSSLVNMRARWYDTTTAEFTSVDPDFSETDHAYLYADDNSVNETDPTGYYCQANSMIGYCPGGTNVPGPPTPPPSTLEEAINPTTTHGTSTGVSIQTSNPVPILLLIWNYGVIGDSMTLRVCRSSNCFYWSFAAYQQMAFWLPPTSTTSYGTERFDYSIGAEQYSNESGIDVPDAQAQESYNNPIGYSVTNSGECDPFTTCPDVPAENEPIQYTPPWWVSTGEDAYSASCGSGTVLVGYTNDTLNYVIAALTDGKWVSASLTGIVSNTPGVYL
jgi:RHS repeat-associated protein